MRLPREAARGSQAGRVDKARTGCREAEKLFAEVQLAHIVVALAAVLLRCDVAGAPRGMVGLKRELGGDLLERVLGIGEAELMAEEGGLRGATVGRGRCSYRAEGWFNVLLGLLDEVGDVEHGFGPAKGIRARGLEESEGPRRERGYIRESLREKRKRVFRAG